MVSQFFTGFLHLFTCRSGNNSKKHSVDSESCKRIAQRIVKRNQILYTADDSANGTGSTGINDDAKENGNPASRHENVTSCVLSQLKTKKFSNGDNEGNHSRGLKVKLLQRIGLPNCWER